MINYDHPVQVNIHIHSEVADFQLSGKQGWMESVLVRHLPPHSSTKKQVLEGIMELLKDVGTVPYDGLSIMEEYQARVAEIHNNTIAMVQASLDTPTSTGTFYHAVHDNGVMLYDIGVAIVNREDSHASKVLIDKLLNDANDTDSVL